MKRLLFLLVLIFSNAVVFKSYPAFNRKLEARRSRDYGNFEDQGSNISSTISRAGRSGDVRIGRVITFIRSGNFSVEEILKSISELGPISSSNQLKIIEAFYASGIMMESPDVRTLCFDLGRPLVTDSFVASGLLEIVYEYADGEAVDLFINEPSFTSESPYFLFNLDVLKLAYERNDRRMISFMFNVLSPDSFEELSRFGARVLSGEGGLFILSKEVVNCSIALLLIFIYEDETGFYDFLGDYIADTQYEDFINMMLAMLGEEEGQLLREFRRRNGIGSQSESSSQEEGISQVENRSQLEQLLSNLNGLNIN